MAHKRLDRLRDAIVYMPHPRFNILLRMTLYGIAVSPLAGVLYGFTIAMPPLIAGLGNYNYVAIIFFVVVYGAILGFAYGLLASPVIGFVQAVTATVFFRDEQRPRLLMFSFCTISACMVYLISPYQVVLYSLTLILHEREYTVPAEYYVIVVYMIALCLSLLVAWQYLREVSPRNRKEKPS
ncbi:MAG: hypothetical protein OXG53_17095 [Chloroflexi bacterium]|nr:hypothetical protein [Chloroflexota bacterium]